MAAALVRAAANENYCLLILLRTITEYGALNRYSSAFFCLPACLHNPSRPRRRRHWLPPQASLACNYYLLYLAPYIPPTKARPPRLCSPSISPFPDLADPEDDPTPPVAPAGLSPARPASFENRSHTAPARALFTCAFSRQANQRPRLARRRRPPLPRLGCPHALPGLLAS